MFTVKMLKRSHIFCKMLVKQGLKTIQKSQTFEPRVKTSLKNEKKSQWARKERKERKEFEKEELFRIKKEKSGRKRIGGRR